ncbi:transcription factor SOX-4-like [Eriocheir sinensis]|uniref:transcription factor SOX-4-like n=1 Tax=Eriocheir sinensis TaxID=95602 RepID=UPI0021C720EB|nr:transcription factor SOX-4-like [Eriocheir sinensis]
MRRDAAADHQQVINKRDAATSGGGCLRLAAAAAAEPQRAGESVRASAAHTGTAITPDSHTGRRTPRATGSTGWQANCGSDSRLLRHKCEGGGGSSSSSSRSGGGGGSGGSSRDSSSRGGSSSSVKAEVAARAVLDRGRGQWCLRAREGWRGAGGGGRGVMETSRVATATNQSGAGVTIVPPPAPRPQHRDARRRAPHAALPPRPRRHKAASPAGRRLQSWPGAEDALPHTEAPPSRPTRPSVGYSHTITLFEP